MNRVETPQSRCRAAFARCDITPPVGIYHRMWGTPPSTTGRRESTAHSRRRSSGWNRGREGSSSPQIVVSLDHCILDAAEIRVIRQGIAKATGVPLRPHSRYAVPHARLRLDVPRPGVTCRGETSSVPTSTRSSSARRRPGPARPSPCRRRDDRLCGSEPVPLAAHRDYLDVDSGKFVVRLQPDGTGGRHGARRPNRRPTTAEAKSRSRTVVNYACHPTTLGLGKHAHQSRLGRSDARDGRAGARARLPVPPRGFGRTSGRARASSEIRRSPIGTAARSAMRPLRGTRPASRGWDRVSSTQDRWFRERSSAAWRHVPVADESSSASAAWRLEDADGQTSVPS